MPNAVMYRTRIENNVEIKEPISMEKFIDSLLAKLTKDGGTANKDWEDLPDSLIE